MNQAKEKYVWIRRQDLWNDPLREEKRIKRKEKANLSIGQHQKKVC